MAALAQVLATALWAGSIVVPPPPPGDEEETTGFVGLNFVFGGGGRSVEAIIGVVHSETDSSGDVTGGKAALHFGVSDGFSVEKFKLTGLSGDTDLQGEAGLGWDFGAGGVIGILGFNGSYYAGGADIGFGTGVEGYIGIHTIGEFDRPTSPPPTPALAPN